MKRKIFSILFALVLVCSFSLVTAVPASAADIIVGPNIYTSIQAAIDNSKTLPGNTIFVEAATYTENIDVNKRVKIIGAGQADTEIQGSVTITALSGPERVVLQDLTVISPWETSPYVVDTFYAIYIDAEGGDTAPVTIQNVTGRTTPTTERVYGAGVLIGANGNTVDDVVIDSCTFNENSTNGMFIENLHVNGGFVTNVTLSNSTFDDNDQKDDPNKPEQGWGLYIKNDPYGNGPFVDHFAVTNCSFNGHDDKGIYVESLSNATFTNVTANNNYKEGCDINLKYAAYENLVFNDCTFMGNGTTTDKAGLIIKGRNDGTTYGTYPASLTGVDIDGGTFSGNAMGISVGNNVTDIEIHNANISGNYWALHGINAGVINWTDSAIIDATNNWWGSASGPTHALNTYTAPGDDSQGDVVSDNVLYVPWLDGLGGDPFAPVALDDPKGQFSSIQAAITAATGTTITCAAGTFTENVVVNQALTLLGAKFGVDPRNGRTGDESIITPITPAEPSVKVKAADITINGFKFTGGAKVIDTDGIIDRLTMVNNIFTSFSDCAIFLNNNGKSVVISKNVFDNTGSSATTCLHMDGSDVFNDIQITDNVFENNDGYGIFAGNEVFNSTGAEISGNLFSHLECGMNLASQFSNSVIAGNTFENIDGYTGMQLNLKDSRIENNTFRNIGPYTTKCPSAIDIFGDDWGLAPSINVTVTKNTFQYNSVPAPSLPENGFWIRPNTKENRPNSQDAAEIHVHYNDFIDAGAQTGALAFNNQGTGVADATLNWWGDVTGPEQATTNPDGKGGKVSDRVDYIPWLTRNFETVLTEGIGYYGYPMVYLETGWNLLSTPFALDPGETIGEVDYPGCNTWDQFVTLNDLDLYTGEEPEYINAYYFDGDVQDWGEVGDGYELLPCDAIYVRMASPDIAAVLASPQRWMPTKTLHKDWNLVGLSWMPPTEQDGLQANLALKSVEVVESLTGYTQVVSPWTNQQPWTYIAGMSGPGWMMQLTKGYWVFMENGPDDLAGSWPTPMGLP